MEVFIEPEMNVYSDKFDLKSHWRKMDVSPNLLLGITYKMVDGEYRSNDAACTVLFYFRATGTNYAQDKLTPNQISLHSQVVISGFNQ